MVILILQVSKSRFRQSKQLLSSQSRQEPVKGPLYHAI